MLAPSEQCRWVHDEGSSLSNHSQGNVVVQQPRHVTPSAFRTLQALKGTSPQRLGHVSPEGTLRKIIVMREHVAANSKKPEMETIDREMLKRVLFLREELQKFDNWR